MFELRRALAESAGDDNDTQFYRAAVEARFGHEAAAIDKLRELLAAHPGPPLEREANEELAGALERLGLYGDAAQAWSQAVERMPPKDPDRADEANTQQLNESLREVGPQTVRLEETGTAKARRNGVGSWNVPVEVNGQTGEWIFDTGANISTVTESEARRMKLAVRDTTTYVSGSTGKTNALRLAVANDFHFGTAHLNNVVFLVLKDEALYVAPINYQITGILGLPVIRALGCVTMSAEGLMRIQTREATQGSEPNLFFDELTPMMEARHGGRELQMFLDTGNNTTFLYPSSRRALSAAETAHLKTKREQMGGAGGITKRTSALIPALDFEILGREMELKALSLVSKQPAGKSGYRDGVFGADVIAGGFTLDFRVMQFRASS
ncbi:MAG: aspartyl protease family protein [Bryobacteraceae bacterium]